MILLDTHVLLWAVTDNNKLGRISQNLISSRTGNDPYFVSSITAWEIALLISRGRLDIGATAKDWFTHAMKQHAWQTIGLNIDIAIASAALPGSFHNDPADRFLVATARMNGLALLTADRAILQYSNAGYVKAFDATL